MRADCVEPNAENASDADLLVTMEAAPNKRSYRRLAAIRALLMGFERAQVAALFGRSERMVRLWILCFNKGGIDALASKPRPGRPRKIRLERLRDLLVPVLEDPAKAAQEHWTGVKVHGWLKEQFAIELGYRTAIRHLHDLDYNLRVPQRWPERQDEAQRAAFLEELRARSRSPRPDAGGNPNRGRHSQMKLPNARSATVPKRKVTHYLLNPAHPAGGSKASSFLRHGFTAADWTRLAEALLRQAREQEVVATEPTPHGTRYVVDGPLAAPDGTSLNVRTACHIDPGADAPRFVTAHPLPKL